jgi:hypothetical protein
MLFLYVDDFYFLDCGSVNTVGHKGSMDETKYVGNSVSNICCAPAVVCMI